MSLKILSITLLVLSMCLCFQPSEGNRRLPGRRFPPPPCCTEVSTADISSEVTENTYHEQPAKQPCVKAIILTMARRLACVDPKAKWLKNFTANMTKL